MKTPNTNTFTLEADVDIQEDIITVADMQVNAANIDTAKDERKDAKLKKQQQKNPKKTKVISCICSLRF